MRTFTRFQRASIAALLLAFGLAVTTHAQTPNVWSPTSGDWDDPGQWSLATPPSATDISLLTNGTVSYTSSIDSATDPTTLTIFGMVVGFNSGTTTQTLSIADAPAVFLQQSTNFIQQRGVISLDNSTMQALTNIINFGVITADNSSTVIVSQTASGGNGLVLGKGAKLFMNGGRLIATNAALNSITQIGSPSGAFAGYGTLAVTNTLLNLNTLQVLEGSVYLANSGLTETNTFRGVTLGQSLGAVSRFTVEGGNYSSLFLQLSGAPAPAGGPGPVFTNRGAHWVVSGSISLGGSVANANYILDGGTNRVNRLGAESGKVVVTAGSGQTSTFTVVNGGLLTANGGTGSASDQDGFIVNAFPGGSAVFRLIDGTVVVTNANGTLGTGRFLVNNGVYDQQSGLVIADRLALGASLQSFTVDSDAELRLRGAAALSNASLLSVSNSFRFDGKLTLTPASGVITQTLMLAGLDLGGNVLGYSNNFSIGDLDLSAFSAANRLLLQSQHAAPNPALYVGAISANATNQLISSFTVYYLPELNQDLYFGAPQGTYALTGGGFLMPIPEPTAGVFFLVGVATVACLRSQRKPRS